jgi:acetoacetyl-CoA reductase
MGRFDGRVAIITGAARGIGAGTAKRFADEGAAVAILDINEEQAQETADGLGGAGKAIGVGCNVADSASVEAAVGRVVEELGGLHVLVNNAGITRDSVFHRMTSEQWGDVVRVNMDSLYNMTRQVIEGMRERGWGRIINISSINGQKGQIGQSNYAAAKAGMLGFTKSLALENAKKGVTVNAIAPGYIDTEMVQAVPEKVLQSIVDNIPVGRLGRGEEIADVVAFLAGERAGYVTGATLTVNGGQFMGG